MHVNKANRGRQERQKKATREREGGGSKTPKPEGGGGGAQGGGQGSLEGGCPRNGGGRKALGKAGSRRMAWRWRARGRESRERRLVER